MPFKVGERVECNWQHRGANFRGTVSAVNGDLHDIKFDDRDFEGQVPLDRLRPASSEEHNPSQLGSWPGSAPPKNWPSSSSTRELDADDISQDSEAYRRWKEGDGSSSNADASKPLYELTGVELATPSFLQNWQAKTIFGIIMPLWGMAPYISYPVWILFFTPLRVIEGLFKLFTGIGGEATAPNIQFDLWCFGYPGHEDEWVYNNITGVDEAVFRPEVCSRTEPTVWGDWWGFGPDEATGSAGYLPSLEGFLLLFLYSYFWLNIFVPTFRPLRIIFLGLCFFYVMAFSHAYIPDQWVHYP